MHFDHHHVDLNVFEGTKNKLLTLSSDVFLHAPSFAFSHAYSTIGVAKDFSSSCHLCLVGFFFHRFLPPFHVPPHFQYHLCQWYTVVFMVRFLSKLLCCCAINGVIFHRSLPLSVSLCKPCGPVTGVYRFPVSNCNKASLCIHVKATSLAYCIFSPDEKPLPGFEEDTKGRSASLLCRALNWNDYELVLPLRSCRVHVTLRNQTFESHILLWENVFLLDLKRGCSVCVNGMEHHVVRLTFQPQPLIPSILKHLFRHLDGKQYCM